jgi:hypothetical protein
MSCFLTSSSCEVRKPFVVPSWEHLNRCGNPRVSKNLPTVSAEAAKEQVESAGGYEAAVDRRISGLRLRWGANKISEMENQCFAAFRASKACMATPSIHSAVVLVPQLFNPRPSLKPKNTKIQLYLGKGLSSHFG